VGRVDGFQSRDHHCQCERAAIQSDGNPHASRPLHPHPNAAGTFDRDATPASDCDSNSRQHARRHRDSDACADAAQSDSHVGAPHPHTNPEAAS
jgi:hypothetical protein